MMFKRLMTFLTVFMFFTYTTYADVSIEGSYQGKNLYVQNPMSPDGFGFCATKVLVNNNIMPGNIARSAFEIDFSQFGLKVGDHVMIVIKSGDDCSPKILNPEVLLPQSTFQVTTMSVTNDGDVKWTTTGEQGVLPYEIEQYRWNRWVNVGEVQGTGKAGPNTYEYKITPHSGENKVRVIQKDYTGKKRKSPEKSFTSTVPVVNMYPKKVKKYINFTADNEPAGTRYEIYDAYGNIVKKGFGKKVDCSNLHKGAYYINFDNTNEKFIKD